MGRAFLNRARVARLACALAGALAGCQIINDPRTEFDPARRDSTLAVLPDSDNTPVARNHILESFGSFGCVSCPDAEAKLAPYIYPGLNFAGYNPHLVVVNYHVKFGSINDPWVTPATQARYDQSFANSLPQVTLDGSNAPFGIPEVDVNYNQGQYDSLIARLKTQDSLTYLALRIDTAGAVYDSATQALNFSFTVANRSRDTSGVLVFSALAVKNLPAFIPIYAQPWEVIVAQTTKVDSGGQAMTLNALLPLTAKTFFVSLSIAPEAAKQVGSSPVENPVNYALIVFVENSEGLVQNVAFRQYQPVLSH